MAENEEVKCCNTKAKFVTAWAKCGKAFNLYVCSKCGVVLRENLTGSRQVMALDSGGAVHVLE